MVRLQNALKDKEQRLARTVVDYLVGAPTKLGEGRGGEKGLNPPGAFLILPRQETRYLLTASYAPKVYFFILFFLIHFFHS